MNPKIVEAILFGGAAGVGGSIGEQLWHNDTSRRYLMLGVIVGLLTWVVLLQAKGRL